MEGILVPIAAFAMIAAIVIVPRYFRSKDRQKLAEALTAAIASGQALPPEVIGALSADVKPPPSPDRDLRRGVIWVAVAVAIAAFGVAVSFDEPDAFYPLLGISAFPGFVGIALIVMWAISKDRK